MQFSIQNSIHARKPQKNIIFIFLENICQYIQNKKFSISLTLSFIRFSLIFLTLSTKVIIIIADYNPNY